MQYNVKDKGATSAMRPKTKLAHVDQNIPLPGIQQLSLDTNVSSTPQLRAKEMASTRLSCGVSQKHLGKERLSSSGSGLRGGVSQKQKEKVGAGSIPHKHKAKEKMCPSRPVTMTEACVAGGKKQHTRSSNAKEKMCHPDQLCQHTRGIPKALNLTEGGKKHHTRSNDAKQKICPPDQLGQRTRGIKGPVSIMNGAHVAREKKQHSRPNTSFTTKGTTPLLKTQTSSHRSNASTSRSVNPRHCRKTAAAQEQSQVDPMKIFADMEYVIQKLNELCLGEDISFEEYYEYLTKLPTKPPIDATIEVKHTNNYEMNLRHAMYRTKSLKISQNVSKNELRCDELEECEEFPPGFLEKHEGVLDWFFHPNLCNIAGLDDYQRLVLRNHWDHDVPEFADWAVYKRYSYSSEVEYEYIKYFETLLRELKWLKDCLPIINTASSIAGKICTRGIFQATKIATRFPNITTYFTRFGFYECFSYMSIEATWCDGADALFFEIWKRVTLEKESLRHAVKEVYKLNKFLSRQDFLKYVVEEDDLTILEKGFQTCMRGITKDVSEDEARELIAEAVKKQRIKPKFYHEYIRKKIDIARSIGLTITED